MSSGNKDIINFLDTICATPEEIYAWFANHKLTFYERQKWGFPIYDCSHSKKVRLFTPHLFSNSADPSEQTCRCGKTLSLLKEDWYIDEAGCSYHWGKRKFSDGPDNGLYSCCNGISELKGCMFHKYHVSNYKPISNKMFINTYRKKFERLDSSNIFALDSEMVYTTVGLEIARVSLLSLKGEIIYDLFIKPDNKILDYNTPFSGVKPEDLNNIKTTLFDAQELLLKVLNKGSILIGHGLENELIGLHLVHDNIVDTSLVYMHEKGYPYRHSLKTLSFKCLNKLIHNDILNGHNSVEDARTCIALMLQRLLRQSQNPYFKYDDSFKRYISPPPLQENLNFYCTQKPPGYVVKRLPVVTGWTIMVPKLNAPLIPFPISIPNIHPACMLPLDKISFPFH